MTLLSFLFPRWSARRKIRAAIRERASMLLIAERTKAGDPPYMLEAYRRWLS